MSALITSPSINIKSNDNTPSTFLFQPKPIVSYQRSELVITIDDRIGIYLRDHRSSTQSAPKLVYGTVRFIGPMGNRTGGPWYGIELEEAIGKNEGIWNKQEYFRCGPKKGIFVNRSKISFVAVPNANGPRISVGATVNVQCGKIRGFGTVRYLGIPSFKRLFHEGNWYGVQMNTVSGRHNGAVNGISYFQCPDGRGLFVTADMLSLRSDTVNATESDSKSESIELIEIPSLSKPENVRWRRENGTSSSKRRRTRPRSRTVDQTKDSMKSRKSKSSSSLNPNKSEFGDSSNHKFRGTDHLKSGSMDEQRVHLGVDSMEMDKEWTSNSERKRYEKRWIVTECGYSVSFLLSDKRLNIEVLRSQIINTFGHIEDLENEQIEIKIVGKMAVLVRITFHQKKSFETGLFVGGCLEMK